MGLGYLTDFNGVSIPSILYKELFSNAGFPRFLLVLSKELRLMTKLPRELDPTPVLD
jgi:hypothetical protein